MANYQSHYTGQQVEQLLATFGSTIETNVTVDGIVFAEIVWIKDPTNATTQNPIYGLAVHPTTGKLYRIKSTGSTARSAEVYSPTGMNASVTNTTLSFIQGN